mmetsp:Transcript_25289/g.47582  ORF Transcript_25289/g.47582 Transcript_25289/m.47582 type:complete len:321 (+) Transcript_25289:376-1338(+)
MGREVVHLYVLHVDGLSHAGKLVDVLDVVEEVWVIHLNCSHIRFEIDHVYGIKADQRHEQAQIHVGEGIATNIALLRQQALGLVQRTAQVLHCHVIGFLALGKATPVDAVVDVGINPRVGGICLCLQAGRKQVQLGVAGELVELAVQHLQDIHGLIVHDRALLLVPKHRRAVLSRSVLCLLIQVPHKLAPIYNVRNQGLVAVKAAEAKRVGQGRVFRFLECPSAVHVVWVLWSTSLPSRVHDAVADDIFKALHEEGGQCAVSPRAGKRDIKVIATTGRREAASFLDDMPVRRICPLEATFGINLIKCGLGGHGGTAEMHC